MVFNLIYKSENVTSDLLDKLGFKVNGCSNFMTRYTNGMISVNFCYDGTIDIYYNFNFIKKYHEGNLIYDDLIQLHNLLCK